MIGSITLWIITEFALIFVGLLSPDIGAGDIYQTIDAIHYLSLGGAILVLLANLAILTRVPAPRKWALMSRLNWIGLTIAAFCLWGLTEVRPPAPPRT